MLLKIKTIYSSSYSVAFVCIYDVRILFVNGYGLTDGCELSGVNAIESLQGF